MGGNSVGQHSTSQSNLDNQKKAALALLRDQGGVQQIRFTRDGSVDGSGFWSANAVVKIEGLEYQEILGTGEYSAAGNPMPTVTPDASPAAVTVIYSDGTSEAIK
jgi:hypothetical protein